MICKPCASASDRGRPHSECLGCDCQHGEGEVAPGEAGKTVYHLFNPGILTLTLDEVSGLPLGITFAGVHLPYEVTYGYGPGPGSPEGAVVDNLRVRTT